MKAAAPPTRALELSRRFLRSLGQSVKLVSLYKAAHPVPSSSLQECWHLLHDLLTETGWADATASLVAGRWLVNDVVVAESAQAFELLAVVFRSHALQSVSFKPECRLYELAAFAEMAATAPNRAYATDAADFLKERGVRHLSVDLEQYVRARRVAPLATPLVQSPLAGLAGRKRKAPPPSAGAGAAAPAAPAAPGGEQGFGAFIKQLVERSVPDPRERAQIYGEAVRHVQHALARHVSEATHRLLLEKQGVLNERVRSESVLSALGDGRVVVDQEGRVLMMDPLAEEIVGRPFSALAGKPILECLGTGDQFVALAKDLVIPENRPVSEETRVAGEPRALDAMRQSVAVVRDERGRVVGTYGVLPHAQKFREAQRLQEEFLANVTHDLKAPLASICSALEVLAGKLSGKLEGEEGEFLDISVRNSRLLKQMIDELLDFSRLRSGKASVRPEPCAVAPMLAECAQALRPWARTKALELEVEPEPPAGLPMALADRRRILQVLHNLVSNAIKFTPEKGRVTLTAYAGEGEEEGLVVIRVEDTGCGIALADQKRIFDRFSQGQNGQRDGAGLGLAIARELVALHRGRLWFDSEPGRGSTFYVALPSACPSSSTSSGS